MDRDEDPRMHVEVLLGGEDREHRESDERVTELVPAEVDPAHRLVAHVRPRQRVVTNGQVREGQPASGNHRPPIEVVGVQPDRAQTAERGRVGELHRMVARSSAQLDPATRTLPVHRIDLHPDQPGAARLQPVADLEASLVGEHPGSTQGGMPGERQLRAGREDPHVVVRARFDLGRRPGHDERRLGQVELAGDLLHLSRGQRVGVEHDGKHVALVAPPGEDVDQDVLDLVHIATLAAAFRRGRRALHR